MTGKKTEVEKKINDFFTRMSKKYGENFVSKLTPEENRVRVSLSMEKDIQEIKKTLFESDKKIGDMEKNEAGRNPLIERRLDNLEKRTDKHEDEIVQLVKVTQSLANTNKVLTWVAGLAGAGDYRDWETDRKSVV